MQEVIPPIQSTNCIKLILVLYAGMVCSRAVWVAYLFLCFLVEVPFFKPFLQQTFFIRVNLPLLKYHRMEYEVFMKRS